MAHATLVVGVTANAPQSVLTFDSGTPGTIAHAATAITGLAGNDVIVGTDYRPSTGGLYAVTKDTTTGAGRLYLLNPISGAASLVSATSFVVLSGTNFGVDFNPVVDRLRVTSDTDINLRLNPNDGSLAATDTSLAFAGGDTNAGDNPQVAGLGYSNNVEGATTTTLYGLEFFNRVLVTVNPPNNGTLNTVGSLLVSDNLPISGFDIAEVGGAALASYTSSALPTTSYLYQIDLGTGSSSAIDQIGPSGTGRIPSIAIAPQSRFAPVDRAVAEDAGTIPITIDRGMNLGTATINYATADGTATAGADYTSTSWTLTFGEGESSKTVSVPILNDTVAESGAAETFRLVLSTPGAYSRIADVDATVAIVDNDAPDPSPEDAPPAVTLAAPGPLAALAATPLTASATDDKGIARVVFMRGARAIGTDTSAPFTLAYTPTVGDIGTGSIAAIAFDAAGQSATSIVDAAVAPAASGLTAKTTPAKDKTNPRTFTTKGGVTLPIGAVPKDACAGGRVKVRYIAGKTVLASRSAKLTSFCTYSARAKFRLPKKLAGTKTLTVTATFGGTKQAAPSSAKPQSVRLR